MARKRAFGVGKTKIERGTRREQVPIGRHGPKETKNAKGEDNGKGTTIDAAWAPGMQVEGGKKKREEEREEKETKSPSGVNERAPASRQQMLMAGAWELETSAPLKKGGMPPSCQPTLANGGAGFT